MAILFVECANVEGDPFIPPVNTQPPPVVIHALQVNLVTADDDVVGPALTVGAQDGYRLLSRVVGHDAPPLSAVSMGMSRKKPPRRLRLSHIDVACPGHAQP